ncbi:hypothetical protein [Acinetobacter baumannii]|uniref:hypothetical protein n=1 Tax=Acinetobacter baumannii TaxID=470 RepID=UPI000446C0C8|nr:hypothetical protein IX88_07645 [Acinetobacter baumannii]EXA90426.1 hypothetical protein J527_3226 [Acinetobacter baumannii 1267820]KQE41221.1 hypothetical protein APD45_12775 [Acinetobacter baumannii]SSP36913.1 Uncharacterised protein [Acinetobacter baumannii]SSQ19199.1 Uncharacterised protein [Acinetobacter baumannii]
MKIVAIFSILLILTGCGKKYTITPDLLPTAHVNQEYRQHIQISGGKVVDKNAELTTDIPEDLGITVKPENELSRYNIIEIKGKPKYEGTYSISIYIDFFGGGNNEIKKTILSKLRNKYFKF